MRSAYRENAVRRCQACEAAVERADLYFGRDGELQCRACHLRALDSALVLDSVRARLPTYLSLGFATVCSGLGLFLAWLGWELRKWGGEELWLWALGALSLGLLSFAVAERTWPRFIAARAGLALPPRPSDRTPG